MRHKRYAVSFDNFTTATWSPRTTYAALAKRRYPAELDDVTLAKHARLERDLQRKKKTIDSIKTKKIQDIETQRKALMKKLHGGKEIDDDVKLNVTENETNKLFRNIQDENANSLNVKLGYNGNSRLSKRDDSLYFSKERFERIRDGINERLTCTEPSLNVEKFKILLRRPSSADLQRKVRTLFPLQRIVRDAASPQSDSCLMMTSKRT